MFCFVFFRRHDQKQQAAAREGAKEAPALVLSVRRIKLLDLQQPGEPPRPTVEVLLEWDPARPPFCRNDNINSSSGSCCSNAASGGGGSGGGTSPESRGGIKSASLRQKLISFCVTFGGDNGESVARMRQYQSTVDKHAHTYTHRYTHNSVCCNVARG